MKKFRVRKQGDLFFVERKEFFVWHYCYFFDTLDEAIAKAKRLAKISGIVEEQNKHPSNVVFET